MSEKLSQIQKDFIVLLNGSQDQGCGWRNVSHTLWPAVQSVAKEIPELVELGAKQVRLTEAGQLVFKYV